MDEKGAALPEIDARELVGRLERCEGESDRRFAFFLGAGCSRSAGIPTSRELVVHRWLPRLCEEKAPGRADFESIVRELIPDYDPDDPATSYGALIERLFLTPEERQREIDALCEGRTPGFGHAVLARLIARQTSRFDVVFTTNFDDLLTDAFYLYTAARPLVVQHESLPTFVRPSRSRPLIVKLRGDHDLAPRVTRLDPAALEGEIAGQIAALLGDRGLVLVGFGGRDPGICRLFEALPASALPHGVYWVDKRAPEGRMRAFLRDRGALWVSSVHFDELMFLVHRAFDMPHPDPSRLQRILAGYHRSFRKLARAAEPQQAGAQAAEEEAPWSSPDVWKELLRALREEGRPAEETDALYQQAIALFPGAGFLLGSYAYFLDEVKKDHDRAEDLYRRAIEADFRNAGTLGHYAYFMERVRRDNDRAEILYQRAIDADPEHAGNLGRYASFVERVRKEYDRAEALYERAIELDPASAVNLGSYASFKKRVRRDLDASAALYERALEVEPMNACNLGNYANLAIVRKEYDLAKELYQRAIDADPRDAMHLGNYALFERIRGDHEKAESLYRRAIEAKPRDAVNRCKYAGMLLSLGRCEEGLSALAGALGVIAPGTDPSIQVECWFYAFAHGAAQEREEALAALGQLVLDRGARVPGWEFAPNVERAMLDGHPDAEWLPRLAAVLNERADPAILEPWTAWTASVSRADASARETPRM